ncbi:MAG: hypothetical protein HY055_12205 [Magnetospirillum sp.]|nr:hypothetical protein [Magnetospirillum sp.]
MSHEAIHAAFESLKADFRDDRFPVIAGRLTGESLAWGKRLLELFQSAGRDGLMECDPLTRFWILRYRGMPSPADLAGADAGAGFVLAFTAFPYLDVMMEAWALGEIVAGAGTDRVTLRCLFDGTDEGASVVAERAGASWRFDLMGLYVDKAKALDAFIQSSFQGKFDAFIRHYVAEHDLDFDFEQAWRPLTDA